ncbi:MAG TPA: patatin-like phospholipase family protein, partial [Burkholderiaceae bacterium]|nr:patatin-like phospholipase family protein [Burkholderiaceae bacterium]
LLLEMRAIEFVLRLLDREMLDKKRYKRVLMHMISGEETLREFGASSKFNTSWEFLTRLRDLGRSTTKSWLAENFESLGQKATVDIAAKFL